MRRVPVSATIREAYGFLAEHLGAVIGLVWMPMVLLTIAKYFTLYRLFNSLIDSLAGGDPAQAVPALLMTLAYMVAALLLYAMMFVAALQLALGTQNAAPPFIHFTFGPLEWRMFRAFFALAGLAILIGLTVMFAVSAVAAQVPGLKSNQNAAGNIMLLGIVCVGLTVAARLLLPLPAIVIHESGPALRRAWTLSAGNFLPLLGILLAIVLPVLLVQGFVEVLLGGKNAVAAGATPQIQMMNTMLNARQMLPWACGLSFFVSPIVIGLFASASASIWRALKNEPVLDIAV
ncbi:MAG: hypothetical protein ABI608_01430 [Rhizomicrobium sp.]